MEDEQLVESALDGDDNALRTLHERYVSQLFHYAYVQTGNHHDAEELLQDIFYKMASNLDKFQYKSSFKTWLFSIGRNVVIDFHRKQKRHRQSVPIPQPVLEPLTGISRSAEDEVFRNSLKEYLLTALRKMPEDYQTVLHLRFIEGFSIKDTAEIMSKSSFSVKSLQFRARKKMMSLIRNEVGNDD